LFAEPMPVLERFRDAELNMGLNYLISPGPGEHMRCLDDPSVPLGTREGVYSPANLSFASCSSRDALLTCPTVTSQVDYLSPPSATCGGMPCRYMAAQY
jgi:hypothetical protein